MSEYYFIEELKDQPAAIADTVAQRQEQVADIVAGLPETITRVLMVGCGDPYFAAQAAVYPMEIWAGLPAEAVDALEFRFWRGQRAGNDTLVIGISQSGKTIQTVESIKLARKNGAATIGITNSPGSPLADEADHVIVTAGGPSYSFPTKTTTAATAVLYLLALALGETRGVIDSVDADDMRSALAQDVPAQIEHVFALEHELMALARSWQHHTHFAFIGSGPGYAAALIGAAKINETCRLQSEADELEEYGHLHVFGIQPGTPLLFLAQNTRTAARAENMVQFASVRHHPVAVLSAEGTGSTFRRCGAHVYEIPLVDELLSPLLYAVPLQLFAYNLALTRGTNPDRPEGFDNVALQKMIYTGLLEGWHDDE